MKVGDLVRYVGGGMGIVVRVCEEVVTGDQIGRVDILVGDKIMYDQRIDFFEVISESR